MTARERDVLRLIGQGRSNAEIAEELCISELTVKSHIGRIFVKLDLRDRAAAIVYAYDHGVVTPRYPAYGSSPISPIASRSTTRPSARW